MAGKRTVMLTQPTLYPEAAGGQPKALFLLFAGSLQALGHQLLRLMRAGSR